MTDTGENIDSQMGSIITENPVSVDDHLSRTLDDPQDTPEDMDHIHSQNQNKPGDATQKDQQNPIKDITDNFQLDHTYTISEDERIIQTITTPENPDEQNNQIDDSSD